MDQSKQPICSRHPGEPAPHMVMTIIHHLKGIGGGMWSGGSSSWGFTAFKTRQ
jgi:hypothetical protein